MTTTTYYNLNIVEGTDIVNPLIVDNPNYEKIDEAMHDNAVAGVTLATEIANATVHAITRENSDCAVIRFIATSQWKAGDTATVDGVPVTALLPSGETLPDGAYVINANVLCVLTGTNLTVYVGKSATDANEIAYNDTNVGSELDMLNSNLNTKLSKNWIEIASTTSTTEITINFVSSDYTEILLLAMKSGVFVLASTLSPANLYDLYTAGIVVNYKNETVGSFKKLNNTQATLKVEEASTYANKVMVFAR